MITWRNSKTDPPPKDGSDILGLWDGIAECVHYVGERHFGGRLYQKWESTGPGSTQDGEAPIEETDPEWWSEINMPKEFKYCPYCGIILNSAYTEDLEYYLKCVHCGYTI